MPRKAIPKKTRFEVFKRDGFKCQYCGAAAPDVLLEVDHIQPVSRSGDNDLMNLITACKPCNAGKSDRTLSDDTAIKRQQSQLAELKSRREQLEMMLSWRDGMKDIEGAQLKAICEAWSDAVQGWSLNEVGRKAASGYLVKYGLQKVLDAIDLSVRTYVKPSADGAINSGDVETAWKKVGGILHVNNLPPEQRRLRYIKGILNRRMSYVPFDVLNILEEAFEQGANLDQMERQAKYARSWTAFNNWLNGSGD